MRVAALALLVLLAACGPAWAGHAQRYTFGWEAVGGQGNATGAVAPGQVASVPLLLPANLTRLVLHLDWESGPTPLALRATGPGGSRETSGLAPPLLLELPLGAAREGTWQVEAENESAAWREVARDQPPDLRHSGNWTVEVEAGEGDRLARWRLTVIWNGYAARLAGVGAAHHPPPAAATPIGPVPVPPGGETGFALLLFAAVGVSAWAVVARWRRRRAR